MTTNHRKHSRALADSLESKAYLQAIGTAHPLTPQEELALAARVRKGGPEARARVIKASLTAVVQVARAYQGMGLSLLDLISEGNLGLLKAVEQFGRATRAKPLSYRSKWIHHAIRKALAI